MDEMLTIIDEAYLIYEGGIQADEDSLDYVKLHLKGTVIA